ncbi:MAG: CocE/NonD family hydrolase [Anaerolineae bacterium]|nr:CocE/NonD family hydrolase [Anaerolineae bacterium]
MKRLLGLTVFVGVVIAALFRLRRLLLALIIRLRPPRTKVQITRGVRIPMRDGVTLAADHYAPQSSTPLPAILIRSPYGRGAGSSGFGLLMAFIAHVFAERGYHVIVQDVRGRFDSGGKFIPYFNEQRDGLDTLAWLEQQPWYNGAAGTWGASYLGIVQWALAAHAPQLKAIVPIVTSSNLHSVLYPDETFDLGLALRWLALFQALDRTRDYWPVATPFMFPLVERQIAPGFRDLPVAQADQLALGKPVAYYREWLMHPSADDPLWQHVTAEIDREHIAPPAHLFGGWYDFFLRPMLDDYAGLKAAGKQPYLTIGPYHHFDGMLPIHGIRAALDWFDVHLKGETHKLRAKPVRLYVMGANEWRDFDEWPPEAQETPFFLASEGRLLPVPSDDAYAVSRYTYDPADPTPALGGTQFSPLAGSKDNRRLEARADVLTFTGDVLPYDLEVIGALRLRLYVASSVEHTDFFARLCDVHPDGRSMNICDGLLRVAPGVGCEQPDGSRCIEIDMWATAQRFKAGHRLRLQVSSAAHPRWTRHTNTAEPLASAAQTRPATQTVYHDQRHPSALLLPVTAG